jgi:hypothetical protein
VEVLEDQGRGWQLGDSMSCTIDILSRLSIYFDFIDACDTVSDEIGMASRMGRAGWSSGVVRRVGRTVIEASRWNLAGNLVGRC